MDISKPRVLSEIYQHWLFSSVGIWSKISLICEKLGLVSTLDIFLNRSLEHPLIVTIELPSCFTNRSKAYTQLSPFLSLKKLITTEVGKDELKIVARTAPKLKKLEESLEIDDAEVSPTVCHTIHTLTLCHHPMRSSRRNHSVLPYLTLPSLKAIHLERTPKVYLIQMMHTESVRQGDWASFEPFMAFLSRSACPLTTLSIQSLALADLKLVDLLTHLPTLLNLSIDDSYVAPGFSPVTGRFIENLQVHRTSCNDHIVPRMHSLKLDIASVVDMIRSRWIPSKMHTAEESGVDCLREFTIRFRNREEIPRVYQPWEDMERNGLRAVVLWQTKGSESKD
ncbi:hypothetical protein BT96DRAFT_923194 [Gymnopus androsaceus JB14]|uniref:F-box domain-containing protein n=1 Tax=Gymnopus androsaceus JB14 TaxID=1447944 RepID=A0A6A4HB26_9AGAR|nr:hypothetical protein BT96DRAFT_923194 [Gymnopus androsaceus JB14]